MKKDSVLVFQGFTVRETSKWGERLMTLVMHFQSAD